MGGGGVKKNSSPKNSKSDFEKSVEDFIVRHPLFSIGVVLFLLVYFLRGKILDYLNESFSAFGGGFSGFLEKIFECLIIACWIVLALAVVRYFVTHYFNKKAFVYKRLLPHEDDKFRAEDITMMISRIHGSRRRWLTRLFLGREWFTYVIYRDEETAEFHFYIGAHEKIIPYLEQSIKSIYTRAEFYPPDDLRFPDEYPKSHRVGGRMKIKSNSTKNALPLSAFKYDDLPSLMLQMPVSSWIQVNFSPNDGHKIRKNIVRMEKDIKESKKAADRSSYDKEELKGLKQRYQRNEVAFDVTVSISSAAPNSIGNVKQIGNTISSNLNDVNELKYRRYRNAVSFYPKVSRYRMLWTGAELANLLHLPLFDERESAKALKETTPRSRKGAELIPFNVLADPNDIFIGYLEHPIKKDRAVYIKKKYLGEHFVLTGKTGSGKSTVLNTMLSNGFVKDFVFKNFSPGFKTAEGFSFIDPAKDTAVVILNQLLRFEAQGADVDWSKVHWFSIAHAEYPLALNLLYKMPGEDESLIADAVTELIENSFDQPAAVAERLLRYCIRTLLADPDETHTILEVSKLLDDDRFRMDLLRKIRKNPENYEIISYWSTDAEGNMKTSALAVKNRIDMFASSIPLKRVFGQRGFGIDIRKFMEEGHIVLFDVSSLSKREIALVSGYLSFMYYRIAETRAPYSLLHLLVTDETHRIGRIPILPKIVAESRKFGLSLGIATQRLAQLPEDLREALVEIQDNFFVCQQGDGDAKVAASYLNGDEKDGISPGFLKALDKRRAVIKIQDTVEGVTRSYKTLVTVPPLDKYKPDLSVADYRDQADLAIANKWTLEKAAALSQRQGMKAEEVDHEIMRYMNPYADFTAYDEEQRLRQIEENAEVSSQEDSAMDEIDLKKSEISKDEEENMDSENSKPKLEKEDKPPKRISLLDLASKEES